MGLNSARFVLALAVIALLVAVTHGNNAFAQYGVSGNAQPTEAQLEECERLGIEPEICTENTILAKHRLTQAQAVQATHSGQVITINKVSDNGRFEAHITWLPDEIGKTNTFRVTLYDPKELGARQPLEDDYDLVIYKEEQTVVPGRVVSFPNGTTEYSVGFPYTGEFTLAVGINDGDEVIEMPIQVTPEFPMVAGFSVVVVGAVAVIVIVGRGRLAWYSSKF